MVVPLRGRLVAARAVGTHGIRAVVRSAHGSGRRITQWRRCAYAHPLHPCIGGKAPGSGRHRPSSRIEARTDGTCLTILHVMQGPPRPADHWPEVFVAATCAVRAHGRRTANPIDQSVPSGFRLRSEASREPAPPKGSSKKMFCFSVKFRARECPKVGNHTKNPFRATHKCFDLPRCFSRKYLPIRVGRSDFGPSGNLRMADTEPPWRVGAFV